MKHKYSVHPSYLCQGEIALDIIYFTMEIQKEIFAEWIDIKEKHFLLRWWTQYFFPNVIISIPFQFLDYIINHA